MEVLGVTLEAVYGVIALLFIVAFCVLMVGGR